MIQIFPGKTLRPISYPYSKEHSCKKSEKSCGRFSGNFADGRTNQPTIPSLTSTDVENCSALTRGLNVSQRAESTQSTQSTQSKESTQSTQNTHSTQSTQSTKSPQSPHSTQSRIMHDLLPWPNVEKYLELS